jgi:NAD(P) transhydrogenase subunit alpha
LREREVLRRPVATADIVVSTAMVPGAPAPRLIDETMIAAMRPGSVIIDLAAPAGGNATLTRPGERIVTEGGVVIEGATDIVSQMPQAASQLYARSLQSFLTLLWQEGMAGGGAGEAEGAAPTLALTDEILAKTLVVHAGAVVHAPTLDRLRTAAP